MNKVDSSKVPLDSVWLPQIAVIDKIQAEVKDVATYFLRLKHSARNKLHFAPGQFNMLYIPGCGEVAISISGLSEDGEVLQHTIRHVGRVTNMFARLQEHAEIGLRGPYGTPWPLAACRGKNVVFVAGGLGLAPLKPVIEAVIRERNQFDQVTLFIGARSPELLLFAQEYERWSANSLDIQLVVDRDPENKGYTTGVVPMLIDRWLPRNPVETVALVCGPEVMMDYSAQSLQRKGIDSPSIYVSLERNMQCAVGFCGHCQLGPNFVCKDGPVLSYDRVQGHFSVRDL